MKARLKRRRRQARMNRQAAKLLKEYEEFVKLLRNRPLRRGSRGWTLHVTGNTSRWVLDPPAQLTFVEMTFVNEENVSTGAYDVPREPLSV